MEMPFGKHEGEDIEDLPTGYIVWCLNMLTARDDLDEKIFQDMDYELKKRSDRIRIHNYASKGVKKNGVITHG
jgi:hypothetical protein